MKRSKIVTTRSVVQGLGIIVFLFTTSMLFAQLSPDHKVSPDKGDITAFIGDVSKRGERKVYKGDELYTIGMPCGGIAAGQLYVRGDGTLANWWIANNAYNTGYGIDWLLNFDTPLGPWKVCYQTFEPFSYIDQGFKITVDDGQQKQTRTLSKDDFDDISFIGEYPVAFINYQSKNNRLPVDITSKVYSPFIPLHAKESATPATILKYSVNNTSDKTLSVALSGWLQNLVCIDLKDRLDGMLRNKVTGNDSRKTVYMDLNLEGDFPVKNEKSRNVTVFDNFESGNYNNWKIEGEAFGNKPAAGELNNQNKFGGDYGKFLANSYTDFDRLTGKLTSKKFTIQKKYICFNISGGSHPGKTCMNLVVDGNVVMTATGNDSEDFLPRNWDVSAWKGKSAFLEIVDDERGSWGHISVDNIEFADLPVSLPRLSIDENHPYFGNVSLTVFDGNATATADITKTNAPSAESYLGEKLLGGLTSEFILQPNETKELVFVLSWYFPNRPLSYKGTQWNKPIPPNTPPIGNMYSNWYCSSLDVVDKLQANFNYLEKETFNFHHTYYNESTLPYWLIQRIMMPVSTLATETCQWWATDKFWAWEGVGSCEGTCTHVWNYAQAMAALFPELERNLREKTDYGISLQPDGGILSRNGEHGILIDGHAGGILKIYREYLMSPNIFILTRNWDKIKKSLDYIIREDENEDGLIVKRQPNTYDISFNGANTYVGGLYLAALRAGEKMALIMKDRNAAERYKRIYEAGTKNTMIRLWNGEYFTQDVDEREYPKYQYGKGCLSDQLFGQTWADLLQLGNLYPEEAIDKTLESIWLYNWTNDVKAQSEAHLPERYYAHNGEPGLFICTWPHSPHLGEDGVRYRDEVWTGIEYQVAAEMIYRGKLEKGLAIVKGVHSRYDGLKHNPWNEIECGDHYARAMASWSVLTAIQNYWYNGPEGILSFSPRLSAANFKGFFTSAEGWGNITQVINGDMQQNGINVANGRIILQKITLVPEQSKNPTAVNLTLNEKNILVHFYKDGKYLEISFDKMIINTDDKLLVSINY